MNLRRKEADVHRQSHNRFSGEEQGLEASETISVSPSGTKAIVIHGRSPSDSTGIPPSTMPAFANYEEFGDVKKPIRKTSLKV